MVDVTDARRDPRPPRPALVHLDDRLIHSETQGLAALYRHLEIRSAIIVPLLVGRNCIGCAGFAVATARPYDAPDVHTAMKLEAGHVRLPAR